MAQPAPFTIDIAPGTIAAILAGIVFADDVRAFVKQP
jgi:hypothetical protein